MSLLSTHGSFIFINSASISIPTWKVAWHTAQLCWEFNCIIRICGDFSFVPCYLDLTRMGHHLFLCSIFHIFAPALPLLYSCRYPHWINYFYRLRFLILISINQALSISLHSSFLERAMAISCLWSKKLGEHAVWLPPQLAHLYEPCLDQNFRTLVLHVDIRHLLSTVAACWAHGILSNRYKLLYLVATSSKL